MKIINYPKRNSWLDLVVRPMEVMSFIEARVRPLLREVKLRGDQAIFEATQEFDGVEIKSLLVDKKEIESAALEVDLKLQQAIEVAKANIERFHEKQVEIFSPLETSPGVKCWRRSVPIENVGLYIPGGTAPLFSTLLMLGVPAKIAGCQNITVCTPPNKQGQISPTILYVCKLLGLDKIFKVGGAQAIAAMGYGTETIPKVVKIFGPGNQYVTLAKQLLQNEGISIDLPAGPSEVLIVADTTCKVEFVAADLLSQAEHGIDSQVMLVSDSEAVIKQVVKEIERQLDLLPRAKIAREALEKSKAILVSNLDEAIEFANLYAPEHLILAVANPNQLSNRVINAGSVFLGNYSPEAVGDYASGTNHTLPTNGFAVAYSGVSVDSFVKKITFQELSPEGLRYLGPSVEELAQAEGLAGHKEAISVRLRSFHGI